MPTKLNRLIEERQAKTGEPRAVAKRNVRAKLRADREAHLSVRAELVPDDADGGRTNDEVSVEEMALRMGYAPSTRERYVGELGLGSTMAEIMSQPTMLDRASVGSAMAPVAQSYGGLAARWGYTRPSNIERYANEIGLQARSMWELTATRGTMFDRVTVGAKAWSSTVKAFDSVANATARLGPASRMVSMLQKASDPFGYGGNALSKVLGEFGATNRAMSNVARLSKIYDGTPSMAERLFGKLR